MKKSPQRTANLVSVPENLIRNRLNLSWLIRLRWAQLLGQLVTIAIVRWGFGISLSAELWSVFCIGVTTNILLAVWFARSTTIQTWHLAWVMTIDVGLLTALLYYTGGSQNPFGFLYIVQIALAAVVLPARATWFLAVLSLGAFLSLRFFSSDVFSTGSYDPLELQQWGTWVALAVAAGFIGYFLRRVIGALAERESELAVARNLAARQEKLASLATMAAGAAHELATPLGTIALVAKEIERRLDGVETEETIEDMRLIRQEVARCKVILDQMAGGAGDAVGERVQTITVGELIQQTMIGIRSAPNVKIQMSAKVSAKVIRLPPGACCQALRSLVINGQDASGDAEEVMVMATTCGPSEISIIIRDKGQGMSPDLLSRIGEPFFTTKTPGRGMGLGVFLSRAIIERLGGRLMFHSQVGQGTEARVILPFDTVFQPVTG